MDWRAVRTELAAGLAATAPYLLAHHEHGDPRCHVLPVGDRRVRLCARCSGVYPGIALGALAWAVGVVAGVALPVVALAPAPALGHWGWLAATGRVGRNWVRTGTGLLLGAGYGVAVPHLLVDGDPRVVAVGVAYALAAAALLARFPDAGWS